MIHLTKAFYTATLVALSLLAGCDKTSATDPKAETIAAPAAPEKPAAAGDPAAAQPAPAPAATAGADVSASGTEARAGDVSVKLPE